MIRLTIVLVHTFAAAVAATGASFALLQAVANLVWEWSFYASATEPSLTMALGASTLLAAAASDVALMIAWFVGVIRAAWLLILTSLVVAIPFPLWIGIGLQATVLLVLMDVMVQRHKESTAA